MTILIEVIGNFISSAFLTYIISRITLTTKLQIIFVFAYFVLMNFIFWKIYQKKIKSAVFKRKYVIGILACILAIALSYLSLENIYPKQFNSSILISTYGENNADAFGREIWLSNIKVDESDVSLADLPLQMGWMYKEDSNNIYINPEEGSELKLELLLPVGHNIALTFEKHSWSGIVEIRNEDLLIKEDLYSQEPTQAIINFQRQAATPSIEVRILLWVICSITLFRVFLVALGSSYFRFKKAN